MAGSANHTSTDILVDEYAQSKANVARFLTHPDRKVQRSTSESQKVFVVIGADTIIGKCVVFELLEMNLRVRVIVRNSNAYLKTCPKSENLTVIGANIEIGEGLSSNLLGADHVVLAMGSGSGYTSSQAIYLKVVEDVARLCTESGAMITLVSHVLASPKYRFHPLRIAPDLLSQWKQNTFKLKGEKALRAQKVAHCIIRTVNLTDGVPRQHKIVASQGNKFGVLSLFRARPITKADVARVVVESCINPKAIGCTLELSVNPRVPYEDDMQYDQIFDKLAVGTTF